jgi:hypothetical protein
MQVWGIWKILEILDIFLHASKHGSDWYRKYYFVQKIMLNSMNQNMCDFCGDHL